MTVWQCDTHTRHSSHILTSGGPSRKDDSDDACGMDEKVQLTFKLVKDNLDSLVPAVDSWVRAANGNCLSLLWGIFRKSQLFNSFAPSRLKIELKSSYSVVLDALQWKLFQNKLLVNLYIFATLQRIMSKYAILCGQAAFSVTWVVIDVYNMRSLRGRWTNLRCEHLTRQLCVNMLLGMCVIVTMQSRKPNITRILQYTV